MGFGFRADRFHEDSSYRTVRRRGSNDYLLIVTREGSGLHRGTTKLPLGPNTALLYAPGNPQDYGTDPAVGRWGFAWSHFIPPGDWEPLLAWPQSDHTGFLRLERHAHEVHRAMDELVAWLTTGRRTRFAWNALERALLWCAEENPLADFNCRDARILDALSYITEHLHEPLRVARIADAIGLSRSRLSHLFREQLGMGIFDYVEDQRIRKATDHLRMSDRPIAEIAAIVGYDDPLYFSKRFKSRTGMSPSRWRKG